jgi:uncharacterized protein YdeI (YjbR/CyaY-like superfamily)
VKKKVARKSAAAKSAKPELPMLEFERSAAWRKWLEQNHAKSEGVWIKLAKKNSGVVSITYAEAVEGALCWGWIDGQGKSFDERAWLQKFTPRRARSVWSKINRDKALALIERGEMRPPGLAEVERARSDGRWDAAYDAPSKSTVPEDFMLALKANARAAAFFAKLNAANRFAISYRLQNAKRPETRLRRIEQFIAMLARGEKLHP